MQLGQMIAKIRKEQGMTQETFAKKFDVTRQTVSNWENEKSYPDLHTLIKISDEFNLSLDVLLKGDTTMVKDIDKKIKKHSLYKGVIVVLVFMVVGLFAFIQFNNESMNDTAKDYMDNYYKENKEHVIFYNDKKDTFWTASQINMVFKRLCEKYDIGIGYDVNQHMLRHTFATRCIESGMPANVLQKIMGHHDLRTTLEVYCDVFANYEKQHSVQTYDYLKENGLLLKDVKQKENTMPKEELQKIINKLNDMYEKQDDKLIKILKMVA